MFTELPPTYSTKADDVAPLFLLMKSTHTVHQPKATPKCTDLSSGKTQFCTVHNFCGRESFVITTYIYCTVCAENRSWHYHKNKHTHKHTHPCTYTLDWLVVQPMYGKRKITNLLAATLENPYCNQLIFFFVFILQAALKKGSILLLASVHNFGSEF